jgi:uncharacterized integral membrane protein
MKFRTIAVTLVLVLLAVFTLLNWMAFITPTSLSLGFAQVQAPLGLIMLVVTGAVSGLFLVYIVFQQAGLILETRRLDKEVRTQRELADQAEASRFTTLRDFVANELNRLRAELAAAADALTARIDQSEQRESDKMDESVRSLSAHLGEVEDKLDRVLALRNG